MSMTVKEQDLLFKMIFSVFLIFLVLGTIAAVGSGILEGQRRENCEKRDGYYSEDIHLCLNKEILR